MNNKNLAILLILIIAISSLSLLIVKPAGAQSIPKPSEIEFSLKYLDNSYDVPPTTSPSIDPYTGDKTTKTISGYHVDRRAIEITIKNSIGASYYNFRYKGHYGDQWNYYPFDPNDDVNRYSLHNTPSESPPFPASASDYTVAELSSYYIPQKGLVDVQVQGLFGDFKKVHEGSIGAMMLGYNTTYNYYFTGQTGDWSNTQTITIAEISATSSPNPTLSPTNTPSPTPTPTIPEFSWLAILPFFVSVLLVATYLKQRRTILE